MPESGDASGSRVDVRFFADKLQELREANPNPASGKPYSSQELVNLLAGKDVKISKTQVDNLRNGDAEPKWSTVAALAEIFGVDPNEFYPDVTRAHRAETDLWQLFKRHKVTGVALRSDDAADHASLEQRIRDLPPGQQEQLVQGLRAVLEAVLPPATSDDQQPS